METVKDVNYNKPSTRILIETIIVMLLTVVPAIFIKELKGIAILVPLIYFFVERRMRHRTFSEVGFNNKTIKEGFKENWHLIILVAVVIQLVVTLVLKNYMPEVFVHIKSRLPNFDYANLKNFIPTIIIATLGEEIIFRVLFQQRLSWYIRTPMAVIITSVVFGLSHYTKGNFAVVTTDVLLVILDSIIYGAIFARTKNVYVSWTAHAFADLFGLFFLLWL